MKWAWVAWPQKINVPEQKQGCRCTVKCYSLCEPKSQAEVLLIQQERVPMASGEGDEIEWELLSDPRGRRCFVGWPLNEFRFGTTKNGVFFFNSCLKIKKYFLFAIYNLPQLCVWYCDFKSCSLLFREGLDLKVSRIGIVVGWKDGKRILPNPHCFQWCVLGQALATNIWRYLKYRW